MKEKKDIRKITLDTRTRIITIELLLQNQKLINKYINLILKL